MAVVSDLISGCRCDPRPLGLSLAPVRALNRGGTVRVLRRHEVRLDLGNVFCFGSLAMSFCGLLRLIDRIRKIFNPMDFIYNLLRAHNHYDL